jgi:hypothetical protein
LKKHSMHRPTKNPGKKDHWSQKKTRKKQLCEKDGSFFLFSKKTSFYIKPANKSYSNPIFLF